MSLVAEVSAASSGASPALNKKDREATEDTRSGLENTSPEIAGTGSDSSDKADRSVEAMEIEKEAEKVP